MAKRFRVAIILEIETSNPALSADVVNRAHDSAADTEALRKAVLKSLPQDVKRVIAITGPELMKALLQTHELAAEISGVGNIFSRPPGDYEPPDGR